MIKSGKQPFLTTSIVKNESLRIFFEIVDESIKYIAYLIILDKLVKNHVKLVT